jgi:hypothetical protein
MTITKPRHAWVHPVGLLGVIAAIAFRVTHSEAVGGMAITLLIGAGIGSITGAIGRGNTEAAPLEIRVATEGNLVGVRIRHAGGISTVTEDLDAPSRRRTVTAATASGRKETLYVRLDAAGRVVEAAAPGSNWAAAESL